MSQDRNMIKLKDRLIQKSDEAHNWQEAAEVNGSSDYYYWDGYIQALDFAMSAIASVS